MAAAVDTEIFTPRQVVPSAARRHIINFMMADIMCMISGPPGIGKSALVASIAREYNMMLIDIRLSTCDPTDLTGYPFADMERRKSDYLPFEMFPLEGDPLPINPLTGKPYSGWIIFLDEINSADRDVQKAAYKLCWDKAVGLKKLHPQVRILGAGNRLDDGAIVEEPSTALQSRMGHMEMLSCPPEWLQWAKSPEGDLHFYVTSYIEQHQAMLNKFDPHNENPEPTFPCERTWHMVSDLIKKANLDIFGEDGLPGVSMTISEGPARDFINWVSVYKDIPDWNDMLKSPETAKLPTTAGQSFAVSSMIGGNAAPDILDPIFTYLRRLPMEWQAVATTDMGSRNPKIMQEDPFADWLLDSGTEIF